MNRTQLRDKLRDRLHRPNMPVATVDSFIDDAIEICNRRFALELTLDADQYATNLILDKHSLLYFYAAMRAAKEWSEDFEQAMRYNELWAMESDRQNITNREANGWVNPPMHVKNEYEIAIEESTS